MSSILSILLVLMNIVVPAPAPAPPAAAKPGGANWVARADDAKGHTTIITTTENDRTVRVEIRNGEVSASIDGVAVPPERVVREGNTVRVLDEDGEPVSTFNVGFGAHNHWIAAQDAFRAVAGPRPMIGVSLSRVDDALAAQIGVDPTRVFLISDVTPDRPAAKAGVQRFDVVTAINGDSPAREDTLRDAVRASKAGDTITLRVLRKGQTHDINVVVEELEPLAHVWNQRAEEEMLRAQELAQEGMAHARLRLRDAQRLWEEHGIEWDELREQITAELREAAGKLSDEERAKIEEHIRNLSETLSKLNVEIDLPRIHLFRGKGDDGVMMVRPSPPAPSRIGAVPPGSEQRLRTLEERMGRIEELLEKLVKSQESNPEQ